MAPTPLDTPRRRPLRAATSAALLAALAAPLAAQNLLVNGDLETNTFAGCAYNQTNFSFTAGMVGATAYGALDEIDVMDGTCLSYGPAGPVGDTRVGMAINPGTPFDAMTLELAVPLAVGANYELRFHGMSNIQSFSPTQGTVDFGMSTVAGIGGPAFWTSPILPANSWGSYSHTFTATVAATQLSVEVSAGNDCWLWLDGFEIVSAGPSVVWNGPCPGAGTLECSGMTPGGLVIIGYSRTPGSIIVNGGPCAGAFVPLGNPVQLAVLAADANGKAVLPANAPNGACGGVVQVIGFDFSSCTSSPAITL